MSLTENSLIILFLFTDLCEDCLNSVKLGIGIGIGMIYLLSLVHTDSEKSFL